MRTLKLTLQYDGTDYVGWQRQENGVSVQALLEEAFERIEGRPVSVSGAGRTDAGVHALGQVASAGIENPMDPQTLTRALNAALPPSVRVLRTEQAAEDFHARFAAGAKTYRYRILNTPVASPFEQRYAWHVAQPLDHERMARAAAGLQGQHDFSAFQAAGSDAKTTVRTLFAVTCVATPVDSLWHGSAGMACWQSGAPGVLIVLDFKGDGFLRHMVRAIVGTLVEIGYGRRAPDSLLRTLASCDRGQAGPTAPARGLFLTRVDY